MGVRMFKDVSCGCFVGRFVCIACADDCDHLCAHVCVKLVQDTQHTHTHRQEGKAEAAAASSVQVRRNFRSNEYSYDVLRPRLLGFDSELSRIC